LALQTRKERKVILNLLGKDSIVLLDLGAAGGIEPRWKKIASAISYFGFEPDARAQEVNPNTSFTHYELLPFAAGKINSTRKLYVTKDEGKSSMYRPNYEFLERFPKVDRFDTIEEIELEINAIDNIFLKPIDFIKLDIQGSELDALEGADKSLRNVLGVEVEVEFMHLYAGQPLLSSVHKFLEDRGFEFIDFINLCRWERDSLTGLGQLVFADALFLKAPETIMKMSSPEADIRKYLSILYIYNRFDLIEKCFSQSPNLKNSLAIFYNLQKNRRKRLILINKLNRLVSAFYSLLGIEFRSHVIY
jgi:FkbM family methyltransferase